MDLSLPEISEGQFAVAASACFRQLKVIAEIKATAVGGEKSVPYALVFLQLTGMVNIIGMLFGKKALTLIGDQAREAGLEWPAGIENTTGIENARFNAADIAFRTYDSIKLRGPEAPEQGGPETP